MYAVCEHLSLSSLQIQLRSPFCQLYAVKKTGIQTFKQLIFGELRIKVSENDCSDEYTQGPQIFFSNFFQTLFHENIQEHLEHGDIPWLSRLTVGRQ